MHAEPAPAGAIVLWENRHGVRCLFSRDAGGPLQIWVTHDATVLHQVTFTSDTEAADFAIASMHDADGFAPRE